MTDKLTLQDCFKYPEAPLISQLGLKCENLTEFIKAVDGHDLEFILQDDDFKLILRDISELTDEEIKKCHDLSFWDRQGQSMEERRIIIDVKQERWECSLSKSERDLTDYLRSINIDIDGFLKSGKAVKG